MVLYALATRSLAHGQSRLVGQNSAALYSRVTGYIEVIPVSPQTLCRCPFETRAPTTVTGNPVLRELLIGGIVSELPTTRML